MIEIIHRRTFLRCLTGIIAAPAIAKAAWLMPVHGDRYFFWEYSAPLLPDPLWLSDPVRLNLFNEYLGPNGRFYEGTWTFFGKDKNIYSDEQIAFRKVEYPS